RGPKTHRIGAFSGEVWVADGGGRTDELAEDGVAEERARGHQGLVGNGFQRGVGHARSILADRGAELETRVPLEPPEMRVHAPRHGDAPVVLSREGLLGEDAEDLRGGAEDAGGAGDGDR